MAVTVTERVGRKQSIADRSRGYLIVDRDATTHAYNVIDEPTALGNLLATVPQFLNGAPLIRSKCTVEEVAENIFIGEAHWEYGQLQANAFQLEFDISGQTQKITQSREQIAKYTRAGYPQFDFKGAINVNEDYSIDGVEILIPYMTFGINYTVSPSMINDAYVGALRDTVGCTNDAAFKSFDVGELLLTKVSGSRRDGENWDLKFGFAVSKNATGLEIGDITGIDKKGWEYLWVWYTKAEIKDGSGKVIGTAKQPSNAFVERVYNSASYAALGIPSGLGVEL